MFKPTHRLEAADGSRSFACLRITRNTVRIRLPHGFDTGRVWGPAKVEAITSGAWYGVLRYVLGTNMGHIPHDARLVPVEEGKACS